MADRTHVSGRKEVATCYVELGKRAGVEAGLIEALAELGRSGLVARLIAEGASERTAQRQVAALVARAATVAISEQLLAGGSRECTTQWSETESSEVRVKLVAGRSPLAARELFVRRRHQLTQGLVSNGKDNDRQLRWESAIAVCVARGEDRLLCVASRIARIYGRCGRKGAAVADSSSRYTHLAIREADRDSDLRAWNRRIMELRRVLMGRDVCSIASLLCEGWLADAEVSREAVLARCVHRQALADVARDRAIVTDLIGIVLPPIVSKPRGGSVAGERRRKRCGEAVAWDYTLDGSADGDGVRGTAESNLWRERPTEDAALDHLGDLPTASERAFSLVVRRSIASGEWYAWTLASRMRHARACLRLADDAPLPEQAVKLAYEAAQFAR